MMEKGKEEEEERETTLGFMSGGRSGHVIS